MRSRAFYRKTTSEEWNLIWEAGPYYAQVAEAVERAKSYAVFVGWQLDSRLELAPGRHEAFRDFILRVCSEKPDFHFYFLMWDYAYFYAFEREVMQSWIWDGAHERVHFVFDNRHPYGGSHHEKFVIIDGETAFVGGVDICDDRWDTPRHLFRDRRRSLRHDHERHRPYHDLSVFVRGEVAADLVEYIGQRWRLVSSIPFPPRPRVALAEGRGRFSVLISRTKASLDLERPILVRETEFLFRELIRETQKELTIENQYFWSESVNEELMCLMRARAGTGLKVTLIVPAAQGGSLAFRLMGAKQTRLLMRLDRMARETGTEFKLACPYSLGSRGEKSIYVHSKVIIVDDRYLAVGSSNFNNRGFRLDTELTLTLLGESDESRQCIRDYARRLLAHWKQPHIQLKPYPYGWRRYLSSWQGRFLGLLPLGWLLDPPLPFAFFLRRRLVVAAGRPRLKRLLPLFICGSLMFTLGVTLLFLAAFGVQAAFISALAWMVVYALAISASWLLPLPTLLTSIFAGVQLGSREGGLLAFFGVLVASFAGYLFGRALPTVARHVHENGATPWLERVIGLRRLPRLLRLTFNPRLMLGSKSAYQGVLSIPMRWYVPLALLLAASHCATAFAAGALGLELEGWTFFAVYLAAALALLAYRIR